MLEFSNDIQHNHDPVTVSHIYKNNVRKSLKRKAKKNHYTGKPTKLICREIRGNEDKIMFCDFDNFRKAISRVKIGKRGTLESDRIAVINTLVREVDLNVRDGIELVMEASNDLVMFSTPDLLIKLYNKAYPVLSDGTFKYCPQHYINYIPFI